MVSRYWESSIVLELFKLYDLTLAGALLSSSPDNRRNTYHITSLMISNLRADNLRPNSLLTSWLIFLLVFGGGRLRVVKSVVHDLRERMAAWNPGDETHFAHGIWPLFSRGFRTLLSHAERTKRKRDNSYLAARRLRLVVITADKGNLFIYKSQFHFI